MIDAKHPTLQDLVRCLTEAFEAGDGTDAGLAIERAAGGRPDGANVQHYVLRGREPAPASAVEYATWRSTVGWPCRIDAIEVGVSLVSTEFLGADHGTAAGGLVLFQTVIYSEEQDFDGLSWGSGSYAEAEERHAVVVAAVQAGHDAVAALLEQWAE